MPTRACMLHQYVVQKSKWYTSSPLSWNNSPPGRHPILFLPAGPHSSGSRLILSCLATDDVPLSFPNLVHERLTNSWRRMTCTFKAQCFGRIASTFVESWDRLCLVEHSRLLALCNAEPKDFMSFRRSISSVLDLLLRVSGRVDRLNCTCMHSQRSYTITNSILEFIIPASAKL